MFKKHELFVFVFFCCCLKHISRKYALRISGNKVFELFACTPRDAIQQLECRQTVSSEQRASGYIASYSLTIPVYTASFTVRQHTQTCYTILRFFFFYNFTAVISISIFRVERVRCIRIVHYACIGEKW